MQKNIKIGEHEIMFTATAATPVKYRRAFGKDIMVEFMDATSDGTDFKNFEALENLAYIMAGGKTLDMDIEEWLEQFEITEFYAALEEVMQLWTDSQTTTSESVKNK